MFTDIFLNNANAFCTYIYEHGNKQHGMKKAQSFQKMLCAFIFVIV